MNTALDTAGQLGVRHQDAATPHPRSTTRPPRKGTPTRRTVTVIAAAITMLAGLVVAAEAAGAGFAVETHVEGLFYGDSDEGVQLFAGATAEDFCNENEPTHAARVFHRNDGSVDLMVDAVRQPIYLYSSTLGGPELIEATCAALATGEPPLQPFAEGEGLVRMRIGIAPDGTVHVVNSTVGAASSADGTTWRVRGWADLMIVDGVPVGSPADFQGLRVTMTGR